MRMNKLKNLMIAALGSLLLVSNSINVNAETITTEFDYTGSEQTYTVPQDGLYEVTLYGAQGGNTSSYKGGKGGQVTAVVDLKAGDVLHINVGGQGSTFNGGGTGSAANGGGATDIRLNGTTLADRIVVAGGGGGASSTQDGGAGGASSNLATTLGKGESISNGSGGGGGYYGGQKGDPIYHSHSSDCYHAPEPIALWCSDNYLYGVGSTMIQVNSTTFKCWFCAQQGRTVLMTSSFPVTSREDLDRLDDVGCSNQRHLCCGKDGAIVGYNAGYGGSNYVSADAKSVVAKAGVNDGNGSVKIYRYPKVKLNYNIPDNVTITNTSVVEAEFVFDDEKNVVLEELPVLSTDGIMFIGWAFDATNTDNFTITEGTPIDFGSVLKKYNASADKYTVGDHDINLYTIFDAEAIVIQCLDTKGLDSTKQYTYDYFIQFNDTYSELKNIDGSDTDGLPVLKADGYTFLGWYTKENGGTKVENSDTCTYLVNTTLYAHWEGNNYTVTFNANGGTLNGVSSKTVTMGEEYGELPTASKSGYNFLGWYTENSETSTLIAENAIVETPRNHTLYALYKEIQSDYEFNYTGETQWFTIPEDGYYKLEAFGAQGQNYEDYSGGKGGYTHGVRYFNKGDKLQIEVGGNGASGGYNGGNKGSNTTGGGSTDFILDGTKLMVAGGGGSACPASDGAHGGELATSASSSTASGTGLYGGGGGYNQGTFGYLIYHKHSSSCYSRVLPEDPWLNCKDCTNKGFDCVMNGENYYDYKCRCCGSNFRGTNPWHRCFASKHLITVRTCGKTEGVTIDSYAPGSGGTSYMDASFFYKNHQIGNKTGDGYAIITKLYEYELDLNKPTIDTADVDATNIPEILSKSEVIKSTNQNLPLLVNKKDSFGGITYTYLFENKQKLSYIEGVTEMPQPTLKGWTFKGWYTEAKYKTPVGKDAKEHAGKILTIDTVFKADESTKMLGNKLYAHWDENVYYIQYVRNDTTKNIYGDECTSVAIINNNIEKIGSQEFIKDINKGYYTQKCLYDHEVQVLQSLYTKTGYFFNGWTNKTDSNIVDGSNTKGTGTGKVLGAKYNECEILTPVADGEKFTAGKCNFNYITDAKKHETDVSVPSWSYLQSGLADGSNTIIMYATWEPIRYSLRYNGTDNWNTEVKPYKQVVTNEKSVSSNLIRYDQYFTLDANKFTRNAPHTIKSPEGLDVVLKAGYSLTGWGFGQNTRQYSTNPSWNLLQLNTKPDNKQGLLEQDYLDKQASVRNVLSADSIKAIDKYVLDWTNARTATNLSDKTELHNKEIIQNLHAIWRRNSETGDGTTPTPTPTPGGSTDPTPTPTPTPGTSPTPTPTKPTDPTDGNFGIKLTFDLNDGYLVDSATKDISYEPIVMKQELFNDYYYEFDIIGNENKDLLNNTVTFDSYGSYSNSNPANNYDSATGLNVKFRKTDKSGNSYRLCGWSTEKGDIVPISPDNKRNVDGITTNNLDVYDISNHNETIQICNDTVLYAIWEPELKLDVRMTRVLGGSSCQSGTLTNANQEYMKSKGIPKLTLNPGEKAKYMISITGEQRGTTPVGSEPSERVIGITVTTQFDPVFTGIYDSGIANIQDSLNRIEPEDLDEPISASSNLNRKWTKKTTGVLTRSFYMPQYLGTNVASQYGYPSFKSDGYTFNVTASRYSNFHKGLEEITAEFLILIDTDDGDGTEPTPTPGGGGDDDDDIDDTKPSDVKTTLDELRTKLKIRIN